MQRYHFCPQCGGILEQREYGGRVRLACTDCGQILYENPIVGVAGILLDEEGKILLGRRNSGPYAGKWCIPCGYLEYDEELRQGLLREFKEETGLDAEIGELFAALSNFHDPQRHTVGIWFIMKKPEGKICAADDLDAAAFFDLDKLPDMAFPTDITVVNMLKTRA